MQNLVLSKWNPISFLANFIEGLTISFSHGYFTVPNRHTQYSYMGTDQKPNSVIKISQNSAWTFLVLMILTEIY